MNTSAAVIGSAPLKLHVRHLELFIPEDHLSPATPTSVFMIIALKKLGFEEGVLQSKSFLENLFAFSNIDSTESPFRLSVDFDNHVVEVHRNPVMREKEYANLKDLLSATSESYGWDLHIHTEKPALSFSA